MLSVLKAMPAKQAGSWRDKWLDSFAALNLFAKRKPTHDRECQRTDDKHDIDHHVCVLEWRNLIHPRQTQNQVRQEQGENDYRDC